MTRLYVLNTNQGDQDNLKPVTEYYYEVENRTNFDNVMEDCSENKIPYVLQSDLGSFIMGYDDNLTTDISYLVDTDLDKVFKEQQDKFYQAMLMTVVNTL